MVDRALRLAENYHRGQKRKDGADYITHVMAVGNSLAGPCISSDDPELICAGYLHDVIEDTPCTEDTLRAEGFTERIISAVVAVSRRKGESYKDFILRVKDSGDDAIRIKLADLAHNLSNLGPGAMRDKYELAQVI
jgi:(p)ppGpp synthase/HD superfamily hydrolase